MLEERSLTGTRDITSLQRWKWKTADNLETSENDLAFKQADDDIPILRNANKQIVFSLRRQPLSELWRRRFHRDHLTQRDQDLLCPLRLQELLGWNCVLSSVKITNPWTQYELYFKHLIPGVTDD